MTADEIGCSSPFISRCKCFDTLCQEVQHNRRGVHYPGDVNMRMLHVQRRTVPTTGQVVGRWNHRTSGECDAHITTIIPVRGKTIRYRGPHRSSTLHRINARTHARTKSDTSTDGLWLDTLAVFTRVAH